MWEKEQLSTIMGKIEAVLIADDAATFVTREIDGVKLPLTQQFIKLAQLNRGIVAYVEHPGGINQVIWQRFKFNLRLPP